MVLLAVLAEHDGLQPGLDLCGISCTVGIGPQQVHVHVAVANKFDGSNEILYSS